MVGPDGLPLGPLPDPPGFAGDNQQPCPPSCSSAMPISGYNPAATGAPPGPLPVNESAKDALKKLKEAQKSGLSKIDKAGTAIASACTIVGLPIAIGTGPEPTTKLALAACAAIAAAMKGGAAVGDLWFSYIDPFDANFRVVAEPVLRSEPQVSSAHVPRRLASAVNALSTNFVQSRDAMLALVTAINRAESARSSGDEASAIAQLKAAARFARLNASLIAARPGLRRRVAKVLGRIVVTPRQVGLAGRAIRRRGLPAGLQKTFRSFGAPAAWVRTNYAGDVARVRGRVDLRRLLLDKRFDALDRDMAAFFHQLETSFV